MQLCGQEFSPALIARINSTVEVEPMLSRREHARVWRALMQRYHPHGDGPLCGAQLRYLIKSEHHACHG